MTILSLLALHFLMLSLISVGGASATIPEIQRVFVDTLHLISKEQFSNLYAISQAAPGPNVLFVALFGWQIAGILGALVSMSAMCAPTCLFATAVEYFGSKHRDDKWFLIIKRSMTPISIGLLSSTGLILIQSTSHRSLSLVLTLGTILTLLFYRLNPLWLVLFGAALGASGVLTA